MKKIINHDNKPEKILFGLKHFESKNKNIIKKSFTKKDNDFLQLTDIKDIKIIKENFITIIK